MNRQFGMELGIIVGTSLTLALLLFWLKGDISSKSLFVQDQQRQLAARSISLDSLSNLKIDSVKARTFTSLLENILPLKDQLIQFPRDMEEIARKNGLEFGSAFGEEGRATSDSPGYISFIFTIGGAYDKIATFMNEAEKSRYIVKWSNVDITLRDGGIYRGNISGKVFSR